MMDIKELKITFQKLDPDKKLFFLGEMVSLFEQKEHCVFQDGCQ
ncbi:hypothetical protein [Shewanella profunda]|nr:hypothetical protein [Shewanella profunda]